MDSPRIPIQNLYYLLCYSWNQLEQGKLVDVSRIPSTELVDLFAAVLCQGVEHIARRGLEQGYEVHEEELKGIRGRIDAAGSARRFLLHHGRAACQFDELTVNTLPNQIIKATLKLLEQVPSLNKDLRTRVKNVRGALQGIDDIRFANQLLQTVQLHSNNKFYRFLLSVCKIVHSSALVDQATGQYRFRDFVRDERTMARVFELFLFNFIRLEIPTWEVKRERIFWVAESASDSNLTLLPRMETDISLRRGREHVIIDAKYYQETMSEYYGSEKIHRGNLFQLMSYLSNVSTKDGFKPGGMLIYPQVDKKLRQRYRIQGHDVSVCTVDLNQPWQAIHTEIVDLIA